MQSIGTKEIITERLILRRIKEDDYLEMYNNWTSDPLVTKYLFWDTHENPAMTKAYAEYKANRYNDEVFDWIVCLKDTNEPIGEIEAVSISKVNDLIEMGNCYGSKYWNKGYATEALKAFINYMFNEVKVSKVYAHHIKPNVGSGKVMQKAGMHFDGILKGYLINKCTGLRDDAVYYSIDNVVNK